MNENPRDLALRIAAAAWDKKAFQLKILDVRKLVDYADYFVICSGASDRQVNAIADSIEGTLIRDGRVKPLGVEGRSEGHWVLLDYADVVVHVFYQPVRDYYELERLWSDAEEVPVEEPEWVAAAAGAMWD
ncbi:MAG: ribosomal silencing factor RsfS [Myxococcales bacterium]